MKKLLLLLCVTGCTSPLPNYMQDAPRTDQDEMEILAGIIAELGSTFVVEKGVSVFYIASNDGHRSTQACKSTIRRLYRFLHKDYFRKEPEKPIRVYLFKDKESYAQYCEDTYGRKPSTPFGFYMSDERKMVMNIATGRGTLAHEVVHPLLSEDFPKVPAWFNEGFASLFEQSRSTRDGKQIGQVNWRLPGLHKALRSREGVDLRSIMSTTSSEFYGDNRGVHYAAARYLCFYLQERGLLPLFYRKFRETFEEDPTGVKAVEIVSGYTFPRFEKKWKAFVRDLRWND